MSERGEAHVSSEDEPSSCLGNHPEVLPKFGLAFVVDDDETTWTITRNMEGPGLDALRRGQRVRLTLDHQPAFSVVRSYDPQV